MFAINSLNVSLLKGLGCLDLCLSLLPALGCRRPWAQLVGNMVFPIQGGRLKKLGFVVPRPPCSCCFFWELISWSLPHPRSLRFLAAVTVVVAVLCVCGEGGSVEVGGVPLATPCRRAANASSMAMKETQRGEGGEDKYPL